MRNTEKYAGKRVLVVGMARSGIAAAQLLCKAGAHVIINDSKAAEQLGDSLKPLENLISKKSTDLASAWAKIEEKVTNAFTEFYAEVVD